MSKNISLPAMNSSQNQLNRLRVALALWLVMWVVAAASRASAATISRAGEIIVTSVTNNAGGLGSAFQVGDVFSYSLGFNDAILDDDSDPDYGEFQGAITGLALSPLTARPGIWNSLVAWDLGAVYTEKTGALNWSFDVAPASGFGALPNGYALALFFMGFAGLPANGDIGGGQTLGAVTGSILNSVSPSSPNIVEMGFSRGMDSELVSFQLINFHAPEPGRAMLMGVSMAAALAWRRRDNKR